MGTHHAEDVQNFTGEAVGTSAVPTGPAATGERETRSPIKGVRKFTAAAVVQSAFTAPHVTEFLTIDVTATMELLARLKASKAFEGYKLTPLTIAAKAVLIALRNNPTLNSRWDEARGDHSVQLRQPWHRGCYAPGPDGTEH